MVGGFLGAGKTTTIGKLAAHYVAQGKNVALVTNDQAYDLVRGKDKFVDSCCPLPITIVGCCRLNRKGTRGQ